MILHNFHNEPCGLKKDYVIVVAWYVAGDLQNRIYNFL